MKHGYHAREFIPFEKRKFHGFTLVELVVVITILAILGAIGFLSVGGYSSRTRDSARVADVAQISKSLDLSIITAGNYPNPDNSFAVTYSWGVVWNQGTVWAGFITYLRSTISGGGLSKKPMDPLKNTEYVYSSLAYGKAYQVKTEYEGALLSSSLWEGVLYDSAYADPGSPSIAYIKGNYGGLTAKTVTGGITYVIAVPSIITNTGTLAGGYLSTSALSGTLLFNGKPLQGASSFSPNTVVYSGTGLPTSDTSGQVTVLINNLKTAYSGSDLANSNSTVSSLLTASGSSAMTTLGNAIVVGQLNGTPLGSGGGSGGSGGPVQTNPIASLVHSSRSKTFTFSWSGGLLNGTSCKLQYLKSGTTWTDISATVYNCDGTVSGQSVTLPGDGWNSSNWNGTPVRILRTTDSVSVGTFPQTLSCSAAGGSSSPTPSVDEDCDGTWDNQYTTPVNTYSGCDGWNVCYYYTSAVYACDGSVANSYDGNACTSPGYAGSHGGSYGQCSGGLPAGGWDYWTQYWTPSSGCTYSTGGNTEYR